MKYLVDLVDYWTERADKPVILDGEECLTGKQAAAITKACMDMLTDQGVVPGDRVAFTGSDTMEAIPVYLGFQLHQALCVGLAPFAGPATRQLIVQETDPKMIVVNHAGRHMAEESVSTECNPPIVENESFLTPGAEYDPAKLRAAAEQITDDSFAVIRYTSGSTGVPKSIALRHGSNISLSDKWVELLEGVQRDGHFLCTMPLSSLEGVGMGLSFACFGLIPCVYRGRATPAGILSEMERYQISYLFLPSSQLTAIVREPAFEMTDLSALRGIIYAGQVITPKDLNEAIEAIGGEKLAQTYGQTEAGMLAALTHADHLSRDPEILSSAGKVFFPDDIEIRDDDGHVVPEGESGEIFLRGKYTQAALWTKEHTTKSLVGPDGWLATTDCGRIIDQRLWITGRKRDMILYRGYNVTSRSIEESLQNHATVADAIVHPVHDDYSGEAVFAWVRPAEGAVLDLEALCDQVEKDLGSWSRPKYIEVIDEIPLVPNALQKFDKVVLRERAEKLIAERNAPGE